MVSKRQVRESIDRRVSWVIARSQSEKTPQAKSVMTVEVQWGRGSPGGLSCEAMHERVILPVEAQLLARYGQHAGRRPHSGLDEVFEALARIDTVASMSRT